MEYGMNEILNIYINTLINNDEKADNGMME